MTTPRTPEALAELLSGKYPGKMTALANLATGLQELWASCVALERENDELLYNNDASPNHDRYWQAEERYQKALHRLAKGDADE